MPKGRIVFWCLFLVAAGAVGVFYWQKTDPLHKNPMLSEWYIRHHLDLLRHPNPNVAVSSWEKLQHLYFSSWAGFFILQEHVNDSTPIHFLLVKDAQEVYTPNLKESFKAAKSGWVGGAKPLFYKTGQRPCATVGQALLAIIYNENKWKKDFSGDWDQWWRQNRGFYQKK